MSFLDIVNFVRNFYYQKMFVNLRYDDNENRLFENVTRPILSEDYAGPMFKKSNLPKEIKRRLYVDD